LFKYQGFAVFTEFALRDAENPVTSNLADGDIRFINKGNANNIQLSYQTRKHHELAFRWARFTPHKDIETQTAELNDFTLAFTKYVRFHRVKVQADITFRNANSPISTVKAQDYWLYRFQIEMGI